VFDPQRGEYWELSSLRRPAGEVGAPIDLARVVNPIGEVDSVGGIVCDRHMFDVYVKLIIPDVLAIFGLNDRLQVGAGTACLGRDVIEGLASSELSNEGDALFLMFGITSSISHRLVLRQTLEHHSVSLSAEIEGVRYEDTSPPELFVVPAGLRKVPVPIAPR
jgi:hypothetical protein